MACNLRLYSRRGKTCFPFQGVRFQVHVSGVSQTVWHRTWGTVVVVETCPPSYRGRLPHEIGEGVISCDTCMHSPHACIYLSSMGLLLLTTKDPFSPISPSLPPSLSPSNWSHRLAKAEHNNNNLRGIKFSSTRTRVLNTARQNENIYFTKYERSPFLEDLADSNLIGEFSEKGKGNGSRSRLGKHMYAFISGRWERFLQLWTRKRKAHFTLALWHPFCWSVWARAWEKSETLPANSSLSGGMTWQPWEKAKNITLLPIFIECLCDCKEQRKARTSLMFSTSGALCKHSLMPCQPCNICFASANVTNLRTLSMAESLVSEGNTYTLTVLIIS